MKNRKLSLLALGLGVLFSGAKIWADNPIILDQFTADPTARLFNGKIYLYPSHDMPAAAGRGGRGGGWFAMEDYHVFSSENLLDWKDHGVILDQKQVPWVRGASNSMWAPDCVEMDGKFYFYFPASSQIGLAIADKPEGPFKVEPQPLVGGIDPCCFIDTASAKDGKKPDAYLIWKGNPLSIRKLMGDMKTADPDSPTVRVSNLPAQGDIEGPFMFERKGIYYLTYPHAVRINGHEAEQLEYVMADNPLGPFKFPPAANPAAPVTSPTDAPTRPVGLPGVIMDQTPPPIGQTPRADQPPAGAWTNHHSIVEYKGQWILFYHANDLSPDFDKNRSVRADYLSFNDDGTIIKVVPTLRGVGIRDARGQIQIDRYSAVSKEGTTEAFLDDAKKNLGWEITLNKKDAWVRYDRVDFGKEGLKAVQVRARSATGGVIEIRLDKPDGTVVAEVEIGKGADWSVANSKLVSVPSGKHDLVVCAKDENEVALDWVSFE